MDKQTKENTQFRSFSWITPLLDAYSEITEKTPSAPHCEFLTISHKSHAVLQADGSSQVLHWRRIIFCSSLWDTRGINPPMVKQGAWGAWEVRSFHSPPVFALLTGVSQEKPNSSQPIWGWWLLVAPLCFQTDPPSDPCPRALLFPGYPVSLFPHRTRSK